MKLSLKLDLKTTYIIAVSGGVDSMVLLDFLRSQNITLKVVNFNHLMRQEALEDKQLVQSYCVNHNIPFHYFKLHLNKANFQNKARLLRQAKLQQVARFYHSSKIITAHHLDDLAETILMKLSRGSTLLGYSGMQPQLFINKFVFLKPFLYTTKKEIMAYAKTYQVTFLKDKTNQETIYQRNHIRHHVIPYLQEKTAFLANVKRFSCQLLETHHFIRKTTLAFIKEKQLNQSSNPQNNTNSSFFELKSLLLLDIVIQQDIILFLLEQANLNKNFGLIKSIVKGLNNPFKPNLSWCLHLGFCLVKSYSQFGLIACNNLNIKSSNNLKTPLLAASFCATALASFSSKMQPISYDSHHIMLPLTIRHKKNGDLLKFNFGTQKLKTFLINRKIPLLQRNNLWLIVDASNNILWIPNLYINQVLGTNKCLYLALKDNI
ncbi:tRNA lysidine(34) synthetase TilS ['Fragaria x ananassa' phyllody phytoplasma]|uniref:tRNA(Ile)-lysidine synthase n=1 Tax='Fragaria x ananassa' phyllody phytoplasma TaxID=2358428 RepID=A0ABS5K3Z2_9MOLU|nr:tRNA lysidine(34) synthetase TilS ['Fragaria x ananassa' phyllody phytoplasma]MBS2126509.1 tRNA lysidine(34) synthetase TilS ['Fragaria x ananassa' phyllody phytoplasma]